jgi:hypothetical protein
MSRTPPLAPRAATHDPSPPGRDRLAGAAPVWTASIDAWPAVGGGLLIGMVVPQLHGAAPLRLPVKSVFIRIDSMGGVTVTIPYVRLEEEASHCVAALVATELSVVPGCITVDCHAHCLNAQEPERAKVADICPASELSFGILGATARSLLGMAAAAGTPSGSYGVLAVDAALLDLPYTVTLRSGLRVTLRGPGADRRAI